jgi:hypothetical protein
VNVNDPVEKALEKNEEIVYPHFQRICGVASQPLFPQQIMNIFRYLGE